MPQEAQIMQGMLYCNSFGITRSREVISCSGMLGRFPESQAVFSFLIIFASRIPSSCSQYGCFTSTHHSCISERKNKWYWWKGVCVCTCWFCCFCKEKKKKKLSRESTQLNSTHSICILLPKSESPDYHKRQT